eukprot:CAMPEP_0171799400 /NCGR_PEP_ID=MMETSP0991-20121206/71097_1 /TAXON_ID=483369 /ORGANISM="non described non described, Strain CCMP2098" /LENGTH=321 /DNA_ID=CAMNT_0012410783 /DNA_START=117 /DNA_END=1083 /DNA_ORIENTATION=-
MKCPRKLVTFLVVASMSSALAEEIVTELQLPAVDAKNDEPSSSELVPSQGDSDPSTDTLEELKERLRHLENVAFANKQQDPPAAVNGRRIESAGGVGDAARRWIINHFAPVSDPECVWNWRYFRCDPKCLCGFQFKLGDYSMSRTCRRVDAEDRLPTCDEFAVELSGWHKMKGMPRRGRATLKRVVTSSASRMGYEFKSAASRFSRLVVRAGRAAHKGAATRAPATNNECSFTFDGLRCEPEDLCQYKPKLGDFTLGRSCRIRTDTMELEISDVVGDANGSAQHLEASPGALRQEDEQQAEYKQGQNGTPALSPTKQDRTL